jgi:hypothetical protein
VYCNDNQLTAQALDTVFTALAFSPKRFHIYACDIHIHDNPGSAGCDKALAKNNGWRVKKEITIREEAVNNHQQADQKMDKNQVLENIKATQARRVAVIKERYPEVYAIVERIEALDLTPFIDEAAESLTEAFDCWAKEIEPGSAVGIVHFEYDDTKEMEVLAYGYENAILPEDIGGFVDIDYGATVFGYGSAGFEISGFWDKTAGINEEEETEGENSDYEMAKMAEIFFHAMKKAVLSDSFLKLPKADELTFAIGRHDSSEIIGYVWKKF